MSKPARLHDKDVIKTFRIILAACIRAHGVSDTLTITRKELEAAETGKLRVTDRADGSIVLAIKGE